MTGRKRRKRKREEKEIEKGSIVYGIDVAGCAGDALVGEVLLDKDRTAIHGQSVLFLFLFSHWYRYLPPVGALACCSCGEWGCKLDT